MHYYRRHGRLVPRLLFIPLIVIVATPLLIMMATADYPIVAVMLVTIVTAVLALLIVIFLTLTILVQNGTLAVWFGLGVFARSVPLTDIARAERIDLPWRTGIGLRRRPGPTVTYLTWPGPGVAFTLKDGSRLQIGTDDPETLIRAVAKLSKTR